MPSQTLDLNDPIAVLLAVCRAFSSAGIEAAAYALVAFDGVRFGGALVSRVTLLGGSALNTADLVEPRSPRYARVALDRAMAGELRGEHLRVVSPEDFVVFKMLATRDRDLEDACSVLRALEARIDVALIDEEIRLLAEEIPDHDVRGRWRAARRAAPG